ncbi:uncharacterized protein DUF4307 [Micromonospora pisi]|uniref:Uncharacterized protein DUF4307 n=1 Tax=Micromonospora pisi TaxID=589240 RepID=A0A495JMS3_9ACTN|nr:DUF4307 domain-containing protein [Micromonospora pisi]RKR90267.1 uncharacterized protein DUF4307 [Micromonospora pisi]
MTETNATRSSDTPVFPEGRYGHRRTSGRRRPWLSALLAVALLAVLGLAAARLYRQYGDPTYDAQVITYTDITDSQMRLVFRVTVPAGSSAICAVRARSRDGAEVAREEVRVDAPPGERQPVVEHLLRTSGPAMIGEVLRCRAAH